MSIGLRCGRHGRRASDVDRCSTSMVRRVFVFEIFVALLVGCDRGPQLIARIDAAGGNKVVRDEASVLLREYEQTGRNGWGDVNRLPDHLGKFCDGASIVSAGDIRIVKLSVSDRYRHHGLLVILDPLPEGYNVRWGSCSIWKIDQGIYEYWE